MDLYMKIGLKAPFSIQMILKKNFSNVKKYNSLLNFCIEITIVKDHLLKKDKRQKEG